MAGPINKLGTYCLQQPPIAYALVAGLFLVSLLGVPVGWMGETIIGLITLRLGSRLGIKTALISLIPVLIILLPLQQFMLAAIEIYLVFWLVVFASILRSTNSWSYMLLVAGIVAALHVAAVQVYYPGIDQYWLGQYHSLAANSPLFSDLDKKEQKELFEAIAPYTTGLMAMMAAVGELVIVLLARLWQASLFNPGGLRPELLNIRMPVIASLVIVVFYIGAFFWPVFFKDMLLAAIFPFVFAGLSLLHVIASASNIGKVFLVATYVLLVILFFYMLNLLALFAIIDSWYDIRQHLKQ